MERRELVSEIASLRYHLYVNNRLRLEFLGELSRLLREYQIPATDDLLRSLVLAVPCELTNNTDSFWRAPGQDSTLRAAEGGPPPIEPEPPPPIPLQPPPIQPEPPPPIPPEPPPPIQPEPPPGP